MTQETEQKSAEKLQAKRAHEKYVVTKMIAIYCAGVHKTDALKNGNLCDECKLLAEYVAERVDKCPFMQTKTFCSKCKVHCYSKENRDAIRRVMRYAGPRMIFYAPLMALRHAMGK